MPQYRMRISYRMVEIYELEAGSPEEVQDALIDGWIPPPVEQFEDNTLVIDYIEEIKEPVESERQ